MLERILPADKTARAVLLTGLTVGLAASLIWAALPVDTLINWIPDDSFYYFQPAAMMARGYIPSFDGIHPGNGFNPLWMFLLVPIFALKDVNPDLPVHFSLVLAALMMTASAYILFRLLRLLKVDELFAACAGGTFLLWPSEITTAVDGEVTPIAVLTVSLLLYAYVRLISKERAGWGEIVAFGLLGGLAILARNDNIIFLGILVCHYLTRRRGENKWLAATVATGLTFVLTAAWLLWNYGYSGHPFPTSGWAVPLVYHERMVSQPTWRDTLRAVGHMLQVKRYQFFFFSPVKYGILAIYAYALWHAFRGKASHRAAVVIALPLLFIIILYLLNAGVRFYIRAWHLGAAFFLNQLCLWYALGVFFHESRRRRTWAFLAVGLYVAFCIVDGVYTVGRPYYPWQREMKAGGEWARAHPDVRVGGFNCGLLAYYGAENVIVLDGNMDVGAYEALRAHRLYDYCRRERITYIVDYEQTVDTFYRRFWPEAQLHHLRPVSRELDDPSVSFNKHDYFIYEIR
jgi:hypothetical protein